MITLVYKNKDSPGILTGLDTVLKVPDEDYLWLDLFNIEGKERPVLEEKFKVDLQVLKNKKIQDKADTATEIKDYILLKELKQLRSDAMKSLAYRKLDPGESFNILLALYTEIGNEITETINKLRL